MSIISYSFIYDHDSVVIISLNFCLLARRMHVFLYTVEFYYITFLHSLYNSKCNIFFAQLNSLILHQSSVFESGMPEGKERGFTLYYYDTSEPSGYCVLDKEGKYEKQRIYLGVTIGCLLAFIAICVPLIFYMIFNKFHEVMKQPQNNEKKNNWRYFTWGTVATCCFLSLIISIYDIYVFASNIRYYPRHSNGKESHYMYRIYVFFCVVISLMIFCFIFDAVLISVSLCLIKKANSGDTFIKDIEIPVWFQKVLKILPCCCFCGEIDRPAGQEPQVTQATVGIIPVGQEQQEPQATVGIIPTGQEQQEPQDTVGISPAGQEQ